MSQAQTSEADLQYAYGVFDAVKRAMDHAALNPEKQEQFELEFINKMPQIFEALMLLLPMEHRGLIYELFLSTGRYARTWMKTKIESKQASQIN